MRLTFLRRMLSLLPCLFTSDWIADLKKRMARQAIDVTRFAKTSNNPMEPMETLSQLYFQSFIYWNIMRHCSINQSYYLFKFSYNKLIVNFKNRRKESNVTFDSNITYVHMIDIHQSYKSHIGLRKTMDKYINEPGSTMNCSRGI